MSRVPVAPALAGVGALALTLALVLLVRTRLGPGDTGWADLAAFAGFLLLVLVAGAAFAGALLAARAGWGRLARWAVVGAVAGALLGFLPLVTLASTALTGGSTALGIVLALVLALEAAGILSARGAWKRAA